MSGSRNLRTANARAARKRHLNDAEKAADAAAIADEKATIDRVAKLTGMARASWLGLMSFLAFVGITLLGVQDADFFIVERETALPLVGVSVPTNLFFYVAPFFGALLYVHMHLYLVKLWKALDSLPKDNGIPAEDRIAPWIVSDMALSGNPGAVHAYPMRTLARIVVTLSIFAFGPMVLAAFWWRSMPKHDEVLTVVFCGLPFFISVLAGAESWRALRQGGAEESHMSKGATAGWSAGLLALCAAGFLTTEGTLGAYAQFHRIKILGEEIRFVSIRTRRSMNLVKELRKLDEAGLRARFAGFAIYPDPGDLHYLAELELKRRWWMRTWWPDLLRPAQLKGVVFVETPADWLPRDEAEQVFRKRWCTELAIPKLACGLGPLARDDRGDRQKIPDELPFQREKWCQAELGKNPQACARFFVDLDQNYTNVWTKARRESIAALPRRDLQGVDLRGADLFGARLEGADLIGARIEGADLRSARIEGADLSDARIEGADLSDARMEGADLRDARMEGATLFFVRMEGADLSNARMERADLIGARIEGADLGNVRMRGADLSSARMEGADLSDARMQRAVLTTARMEGADLRDARLEGAYVFSASVRSVDYTTVALSQAQINGMFGDASVTLPEGRERPEKWPTWELPTFGEHNFDDEWRKWQDDPEGYEPPDPPE